MNFDWRQYSINYPELKITNKAEALIHYKRFGKDQGLTDIGNYRNHAFYTHQPVVAEIIKLTTGNILECGCGIGSTLFIENLIKNTDRKLVSLESNQDWLNKIKNLSKVDFVEVLATNDDTIENATIWVETIKKLNQDFEVVFIDSSPWLSRKVIYDYFKNKNVIMIIHDFDYFPNTNLIGKTTKKETYVVNGKSIEKIECDLDSVVNNYKLFYPPEPFFAGPTGPPTLVCSNRLSKEKFNTLIQTIEANVGSYYI